MPRDKHCDRRRRNSKELDVEYAKIECAKIHRLKTDKAKAKNLEACKIEVCNLDAKSLHVDNVVFQGTDLNSYLNAPRDSQGTTFNADETQSTGVFGDRTPVKPPTVNERVWNAMLLQLRDNVIPQLGARLAAGRERLGLPQILNDMDIVSTTSVPAFVRSYPDPPESEDPNLKDLFTYLNNIGWNVEVANAALPLDQENKPLSKFTGYIEGDILTVTSVAEGYVLQGSNLDTVPSGGLPPNTLILDQISVTPEGGPFFKTGTYKLDISMDLPSTEMVGYIPQGPRTCSIYLHYGYIDKDNNVKVIPYDLGTRQFAPTIDFNPNEDPSCVTSWGEKYSGFRAINTNVFAEIWKTMKDLNDTGCFQLVILRETGVIVYVPGGCDENGDMINRAAVTTQVNNPNCLSNCYSSGNTSGSTNAVDVKASV